MLEHSDIISLSFLLYLKNVDVLREFFDVFPGQGIDKGGLTDTVPSHETILPTLYQL